MAIDNNKRTTLKYMAVASSAVAVPGLAAAACKHGTENDYVKSDLVNGTGLVVTFSEKANADGSRQIIVTNPSSEPVTLKQVYPSIVSTVDGQYDLNSLLVNGSREFGPKQSSTLTIQMAHRDVHKRARPPLRNATATISVQTRNANVKGGTPVSTTRLMFS